MYRIFTDFQQAGCLYNINHWKAVNIRGVPKLKKFKRILAVPNISCDCFCAVLHPSVVLNFEITLSYFSIDLPDL